MLTRTDGLILRVVRFKESDRFLRVLVPTGDVLEVLARAVGRSQKRFGGGLEPLSLQRFELSQRRTTLVAEQAQHLEDHLELRRDLGSFYLASYAAERALGAAPSAGLFELLTGLLSSLRTPPADLLASRLAFDLKLLALAGFGSQATACATCGRSLGDRPAALDPSGHGFACGEHAGRGCDETVDAPTRVALDVLEELDFTRLGTLRLPAAQRGSARGCVQHFMQMHFPGEMRSERLLAPYLR